MRTLTSETLQADLLTEHRDRLAGLDSARLDVYLGLDPLTGEADPPSRTYVGLKCGYASMVGVQAVRHTINAEELSSHILQQVADGETDGIMVQHPFPGFGLPSIRTTLHELDERYDVDGMVPNRLHTAATPLGIMKLLAYHGVDLHGLTTALIGSESEMIGKPLQPLLLASGSMVQRVDTQLGNAGDLRDVVAEADIVISAVGKPGLLNADMLRDGQVVIDAATRVVELNGKHRQVGDLDLEAFASGKDFWANPPTGVIGPLTVRCLIDNVITSAEERVSKRQAA